MNVRPINLFQERCIHDHVSSLEKEMTREIDNWDDEQVLNTGVDAAVIDLSEMYRLTPPEIDFAQAQCDRSKSNLDGSARSNNSQIWEDQRFSSNQLFYVAMTVPCSGDTGLLNIQPNPYYRNIPRAEMDGSNLIFYVIVGKFSTDDPKPQIDSAIELLQKCTESLAANCHSWNENIEKIVREHIQQRISQIQESRERYKSIGYPIKGME